MRAITVWQPWASLIAAKAKPYEFRGWHPPESLIGERLAIHAGARRIRRADLDYIEYHLGRPGEIALWPSKAVPIIQAARRGELPYSCIVCIGTLEPPMSGLQAAKAMGMRINDSDREGTFNWAWPLTDIEVLPNIPARGRQGLWHWEGLCP